MTFNEMNVSLHHISGKDNNISHFSSRNPIEGTNEDCQVCKLLSVESEITVKSLNTEVILSGNFEMPFTNHVYWKNAQKENNDLIPIYHLYLDSARRKKILKL